MDEERLRRLLDGVRSGSVSPDSAIEQLRALDISGVHLSTTSLNAAACRLYESMGFRLLSACPTRMWAGLVKGPVEERLYGMRLA